MYRPLFISTTDNVIEILSSHVTVDLNGFSISCLLPSCSGMAISATIPGNTATENDLLGLNLTTGVGYSQNVVRNNTGGTVDGGVPAGGNVCDDSATCP